jgi:hypothetical protein
VAHGDDLAQEFPGTRGRRAKVGRSHYQGIGRSTDGAGVCGRRNGAATGRARCRDRRFGRDEPRDTLLLAEQEPGPIVLYRCAVRHDQPRTDSLGPLSGRPGNLGRDLRPVRCARFHVGRYRHAGWWLVPQRTHRCCRYPGPAVPYARPGRPGLGQARRLGDQHGGRRDLCRAAVGHARRGRVCRSLQRSGAGLLPDCQELLLPQLRRAGPCH